ncbi:MAG: hypothetical protein QGF64_07460, partial [Candidatus Poseidoniia archaeon]|nr:hypothetical protein [Candidatus Poseidoniia archaeon]
MFKELGKRIITSILLFLFTIFCIFTNFFIPALMIVSLVVFIEISNMIYRINRNVNNWKNVVFYIIALFYIIFIFVPSASGLQLIGPVFFLYILSVCICSD